ncbi:hypothetical protein GCM10009868_23280 [Terrabacter aerolatus]|uniref:AbiEi antitoxin N-terminal domain-containing protein n=1 Tax=Terrabacter aerolatus TaxID=422442 RepID=A0A512D2F7_9MICO|nr:type IV toxin-antitoxin system AbiEi family antitoxin domain-containing protein [Terrabacter aerolatus]GEO30430.1 hypothetical protein TAE01_22400 [Terrabacter aerolatus]
MDPRIEALAGSQGGVFAAHEAQAAGLTKADLHRAVRSRQLVRVRRGAYVRATVWQQATGDERYRLRCLAVARSRPGDALSHHAAIGMLGLPLWNVDADRIDLVSDTVQSVRRGAVWLHPDDGVAVVRAADAVCVSPARAVVRTALTMGQDCAVVAGDAALHRGLVTLDDLMTEVAAVSPHQGRGRALEAVLLMDGRSESVGESRTRLALRRLGLQPESQVVLRDEEGRFVARVDLLVDGVVLEFDGLVKYARQRDAEDGAPRPEEVLWLEKRREDAIRRLGHPVERVIWNELERPGLIGARVRSAKALVVARPPRPA